MTRPLREYLLHIINACDQVAAYVQGVSREGFFESPLVRDAVIRQIEIVGEAGHQLLGAYGEDERLSSVRSSLIAAYGMRNLVIHGYFDVDPGIVWETVVRDLPKLRAGVESLFG